MSPSMQKQQPWVPTWLTAIASTFVMMGHTASATVAFDRSIEIVSGEESTAHRPK